MLDRAAQGWLARALGELAASQSRRFEDLLWLGFGDEWMAVLGLLVRDGGVKRAATNDGWVLLAKGEDLRRRLVEKTERAGGASGSGSGLAIGLEPAQAEA